MIPPSSGLGASGETSSMSIAAIRSARQIRRRDEPHRARVLVDHRDGGTRTGVPPLDHSHDGVERLDQRHTTRDELEDPGLVGTEDLGASALRHVAGIHEDAADRRVGAQIDGDRLHVEPGAVLVAETVLDGYRHAGELDLARERVRHHRSLIGVQQLDRLRAEQLVGRVAEHRLVRRTREREPRLGVVDRDHVHRVLHERAESIVAETTSGLRC